MSTSCTASIVLLNSCSSNSCCLRWIVCSDRCLKEDWSSSRIKSYVVQKYITRYSRAHFLLSTYIAILLRHHWSETFLSVKTVKFFNTSRFATAMFSFLKSLGEFLGGSGTGFLRVSNGSTKRQSCRIRDRFYHMTLGNPEGSINQRGLV